MPEQHYGDDVDTAADTAADTDVDSVVDTDADSAADRRPRPHVVVVVPTYDERDTLPDTLSRLRASVPDADVLVVDDASPDGTGDLAEAMAADDRAVHVLHRAGKQGLGPAYVAGFRWALERGYDVVVEMDADGSHRPEELPRLLSALAEDDRLDLVIGSRWVRGGAVENWPAHRELLSRGGNAFTRAALGLPVRDATAGFRAFRAEALRALPLSEVASQGYCFQVDMAWRVAQGGGAIHEVPIRFVERTQGRSKMSREIVLESLLRITAWGARHRWDQLRSRVSRSGGRGPRPDGETSRETTTTATRG